MNEKFKEMLIQSEVFNKDGTVLKDVTGYELNKFAELLVRECALAGLETHGSYYVHDDILKHFGLGVGDDT